MWQGSRLDAGGSTRGDDLTNLKCGSPNLLNVGDNTVFAVCWCHEDEISVICSVWLHVA